MNARAMLLSLWLMATTSLAPTNAMSTQSDVCARLCGHHEPEGAVPAPKPTGAIQPPACPQPVCPALPRIPSCPPCPSPCVSDLNATCPLPCPPPTCPTPFCPQPRCPDLHCPPTPKIPPCPPVSCPAPVCHESHCPTPVCPQPICPKPLCPSLPPAPPCPECSPKPPNVSCPQPVCPQPRCPDCPKLPPIPACPTCPSLTCPECPKESPSSGRGEEPVGCGKCLWRVLVTYDHFQGFGFYKAYKLALTWHQANTTCTNDGGHLAIINSKAEADILKLLYVKSQLSGWIFIGFHDLYQEGKYMTVKGEPLSKSGYVNWLPRQPDNHGNEDCGTIEHRALLNDGKCDWKVGFICEVPEKKALGINAQ